MMNKYIFFIGALTSKVYAFMGRAWELERIENIDYQNILGSSIYIEVANLIIIRILPRLTKFQYSEQITDQIRFSYDTLFFQRIFNIYEYINNIYVKSNYNQVYFYINNLKKFNIYYLFSKKLKLNLLLVCLLNEDCDFFLIKKLLNLSNFNLILNFKNFLFFKTFNLNNFFMTEDQFEKSLKVDVIQLIGVNLRMEQPLLMNILLYKKKFLNFKIYSIYTSQSSIFNYKSYAFSLVELFLFFFFKHKNLNKSFLKKTLLKVKNIYSFTYYLNYKLSNIIYNKFNLNYLILNFFNILKLYYNIYWKFLIDNLYYYNYLFLLLDVSNLEKNLNFVYKDKLKENIKFNLYYESYVTVLLNINSSFWFYFLNNVDVNIFIGHHFLFINKNFYKFFLPITFFFEMDSLYFNFFGNLLKGKFIYSPMLKVYENVDFIDYLFNLKKKNKKIISFYSFFFFNKVKYNLFYFIMFKFKKNFKFKLSFLKDFYFNFFYNYYYILQFNKNLSFDFLNNLEIIKNSSFYQSQNLSFYKFNNYNFFIYMF